MMPFWVRILLGILLGLLALAGLWLGVGVTWVTATVAALVAPLGFLGSFFLWTADQPAKGYEQVLFDRPNTLVSAGMVLAFALAGLSTGLLGAPSDAPEARDVALVAQDYDATARAYIAGTMDGPAARAKLDELKAELAGLTGPKAEALAKAVDAQLACIGAGQMSCDEATNWWVEYRII